MSERTKNQLKQPSSILLISKILQNIFFYYGEQSPYRAERMDGLYIVPYTTADPPKPTQSDFIYPLRFAAAWLLFGPVSQIHPKDLSHLLLRSDY